MRRDLGTGVTWGTYKLKAKAKQAKSNKKVKRIFTGEAITFDAVHGSTCKLSLKGEGIEPGNVTILGPDGPVAFAPKGKTGRVSGRAVLDAGTGTYTVRLGTVATVTAKWSLNLPRIKGTVGE